MARTAQTVPTGMIDLRLLGPLEIWIDGSRQSLPRSKKTRALLAYLAASGRAHRRERLCDLFWDITDDPRGGLRWSLSRLRREVSWDEDRLVASREDVSLRTAGMRIDAAELSACVRDGVESAATDVLERLATVPRGAFLEGLDLPDQLEFNAWCVSQREKHREEHCAVLAELVSRRRDEPERALPFARLRAQEDALSVDAHADLLRLLVAAGKLAEAEKRYENCQRLFRDLGASGFAEVEVVWRELYTRRGSAPAAPAVPAPPSVRTPSVWPFVGRARELAILEQELSHAGQDEAPRIVLVTGEPGAGKTRLAERWMTRASSAGFAVLTSRAYEAERTRPYGPWGDALGVEPGELLASAQASNRDALFSSAIDALGARAGANGTILSFDDLQWFDRDSVELLHVVARTYRRGPLVLALFARSGELPDNEPVIRALRSMGKEHSLVTVELEPLSRDDIHRLVVDHAGADADTIFAASAGNPLYAIELARAGVTDADATPSSVIKLVRERVEALPDHAIEVLRWGAVLGHAMSIERLEALCSLDLETIVDALECLDHHALLRIDATKTAERYVFSHDVVREAVYGDLSVPRRRLMHKKVVELLAPRTAEVAVATEVAHHAARAGESLPGVRACLVAGRQSLRVFANSDAESLARSGLRLAEDLDGPERVTAMLDLLHLQYSARMPERTRAAERVLPLAEQALDLGLTHAARLGYQMVSFFRWETSSLAAAHDNIMQAERVSRSADPAERTAALANAAKCLVLLERNLPQAEAFVLEADGLTARGVAADCSVSLAHGMIAAHRGEHAAAAAAFRDARDWARQQGERLTECGALEQWAMLELDRGHIAEARDLADTLVDLGGKVRPGPEAPSGRALSALARLIAGEPDAEPALRAALESLRTVDAKYQQSFILTRWADAAGDRALASEALDVSRAIRRPSETAIAHAVLARCATDPAERDEHLRALRDLAAGDLSATARARVAG